MGHTGVATAGYKSHFRRFSLSLLLILSPLFASSTALAQMSLRATRDTVDNSQATVLARAPQTSLRFFIRFESPDGTSHDSKYFDASPAEQQVNLELFDGPGDYKARLVYEDKGKFYNGTQTVIKNTDSNNLRKFLYFGSSKNFSVDQYSSPNPLIQFSIKDLEVGSYSLIVSKVDDPNKIQNRYIFTIQSQNTLSVPVALPWGDGMYDIAVFKIPAPKENYKFIWAQKVEKLPGKNEISPEELQFQIDRVFNQTDLQSYFLLSSGVYSSDGVWFAGFDRSTTFVSQINTSSESTPMIEALSISLKKPFLRKFKFSYTDTFFKIRVTSLFFEPEANGDLKTSKVEFTSLLGLKNAAPKSDDGLSPGMMIESDAPEIIELAQKITIGLNTNEEKAKALYQWITLNITYKLTNGSGHFVPWTALDVLNARTSVCGGFANLYTALLRSLGITAYYVEGRAEGKSIKQKSWEIDFPKNVRCNDNYWNHAWTKIYLNGSWVFSDSTWGRRTVIKGVQQIINTDWGYFSSPISEAWKDHLAKDDICVNQ